MRAGFITIGLVALAIIAADVEARGASGRGGGTQGTVTRGMERGSRGTTRGRASRPAARPVTSQNASRGTRNAYAGRAAPGREVARPTRGAPTSPGTRTAGRRAWDTSRFAQRGSSRAEAATRGARAPRTRGTSTPTTTDTGRLSTRDYLSRRFAAQPARASRPGARTRGADGRHDGHIDGRHARAPGYTTIGTRHPADGAIYIGASTRYSGWGGYCGSYYNPWRQRYCGFYYPGDVSCGYVPYGFYGGSTTIYIDGSAGVREDYVVERYETVKTTEAAPATGTPVEPAAGSAAAERYMREATEQFTAGNYPEAARRFRLAAIAAPDQAGPLFALGQSLIALQNYPYAAKVIRRAIDLEPTIVNEGADLVGVYGGRQEFDRVTKLLEERMKERPADLNLPFLLGVQQYFSGDPAARDTLAHVVVADGTDRIAVDLLAAAQKRFRASDDLPPIEVK